MSAIVPWCLRVENEQKKPQEINCAQHFQIIAKIGKKNVEEKEIGSYCFKNFSGNLQKRFSEQPCVFIVKVQINNKS